MQRVHDDSTVIIDDGRPSLKPTISTKGILKKSSDDDKNTSRVSARNKAGMRSLTKNVKKKILNDTNHSRISLRRDQSRDNSLVNSSRGDRSQLSNRSRLSNCRASSIKRCQSLNKSKIKRDGPSFFDSVR